MRSHELLNRRHARRRGRYVDNNALAEAVRALGASVHFDPSWGATDNGTVSRWVDRIGGYTVASTSQATRMTYSPAVAGLNNRPGWTGVAANTTKLVSSDAGLVALMADTTAYSVYFVYKATTVAAINSLVGTGSTTGAHFQYLYANASTGRLVLARGDGTSAIVTSLVENGTSACVASCVYTGSTGSLYANASPGVVAGAIAKSPVPDRFVIGSALSLGAYVQSLDGDVADIIIFPTAHTATERRYVEQLIAAKYGWPVLQGVSGFSALNYAACNGFTTGIRGSNSTGVWSDCLFRADVLPSLNPAVLHGAYAANTGQGLTSAVANLLPLAYNGTVAANGPAYTQLAADVGKLQLGGLAAGPANLLRTFRQGAEVGAGTALTGFAQNSNTVYSIGARASASPASQYTIFGVAGGDSAQVVANAAARAAAIKAAGSFVATGGVAPTHGWALNSAAASYADLVGADTMTTTGTLTAAQIIVPTWPW